MRPHPPSPVLVVQHVEWEGLAAWLAEPLMLREARRELGPDAGAILRAGADAHGRELVARSTPGFGAFAEAAAARAAALSSG
jgi:hypothetical protein